MHLIYIATPALGIIGIILYFRLRLHSKGGLRLGKESRLKICRTIAIDKITDVYIVHFRRNRGLGPAENREEVIKEEYAKAGLAHAEFHDMEDLKDNPSLKRGFISSTLSSRISPTEVFSIHVGVQESEVECSNELPYPNRYRYFVAIKVGHVTSGVTNLTFSKERAIAGTA